MGQMDNGEIKQMTPHSHLQFVKYRSLYKSLSQGMDGLYTGHTSLETAS